MPDAPSPTGDASRPRIHATPREALAAQLAAWNQPAYRTTQILEWLYSRRAPHWEAMTNLPKALRAQLTQTFAWPAFELVTRQGAGDATTKFLWRLSDGALIETVLIPANPALYGEASDRHTLCVSTQVGCAYGCRFCASGLDGWKRNLDTDEIVQQVLAVERWHASQPRPASPEPPTNSSVTTPTEAPTEAPIPALAPLPRDASIPPSGPPPTRLISNLVIMGMGEPLANYDALLRALRILNAPWGGGIGARKITISTSGLAPQIRRLADEPEQFRLAISLHGATDSVRDQIMPVNRRHPLRELMAACTHYQDRKGRMLTFEYILIAGLNDAPEHARALVRLASPLMAKVNLIPCNPVEGLPWQRPAEPVQETFLAELERGGLQATLRREKGGEIDAACGQLRLKTERALHPSPPPT